MSFNCCYTLKLALPSPKVTIASGNVDYELNQIKPNGSNSHIDLNLTLLFGQHN
jgi:hypothetical protein